jgi:hypothetical protein
MSRLDILRQEYPGDEAWEHFFDVFRRAWLERPDQAEFLSAIGDEQIAIVLAVSMGDRAIKWSSNPIGALDGRSPADVLANEPAGSRIVRTLLMRMPR